MVQICLCKILFELIKLEIIYNELKFLTKKVEKLLPKYAKDYF